MVADDRLLSFHQRDGQTPHTSEMVARIQELGYTYPEISGGPLRADQARRTAIRWANQL
jgi:hypothetical protein